MSELTSIKVPRQVRDRFATAANIRGVTIRTLLDGMSRDVVDAAMMEEAATQMMRVRDNEPDEWADYLDEGREWEQGTGERLDT